LPHCDVLENVIIPALAERQSTDPVPRARRLVDSVGLSQRIHHRPAELSGGERQRVAVARAMINQPNLVLADEPTGNLDAAAAESVAELMLALQQEDGAMLIVVTHSTALAEKFERRYELKDGKLSES
jgi:lipoprotein-releasing system ATP-binding protein